MGMFSNKKSLFSEKSDSEDYGLNSDVYYDPDTTKNIDKNYSAEYVETYDPEMGGHIKESADRDNFDFSMMNTLIEEGGGKITNDPKDSGGLTKFGFAQKHNPDIDVRNLTKEKAYDLAYERYWKAPKINTLPNDAIRSHVFDMNFLGGKNGIRAFQLAIREAGIPIKADGSIGPKTVKATQEALDKIGSKALHSLMAENRIKEFEKIKETNPEKHARFIDGWSNRTVTIHKKYGDK